MACHQRLGTAHTEERRRAWHDIITFGQHTRLNYVGRGMPSSPLGSIKWSNDVGRGMPSSPLGSTHGRTTSGVACHHRLWAAHTIERRRACHAITAIGQHTIGRHRAWHEITALGQHTQSDYVRQGMTSPPLYGTHGRTTLCVACHHCLWEAHTVE